MAALSSRKLEHPTSEYDQDLANSPQKVLKWQLLQTPKPT